VIKYIYDKGEKMIDQKVNTLLAVVEKRNFTKAAEELSLTQPAVSHHISELEKEIGTKIFVRGKGDLKLTDAGEITVKYARRMKAMYKNLKEEIAAEASHLTRLKIGITHTSESNEVAEVLAKYSSENTGMNIMIITDTIKNLYDMIENYEIDLAVVGGRPHDPGLCSLMLDTDYLVCVMSNDNPLSVKSMVTIEELKNEKLILRLSSSETRSLFESALQGVGETIDDFNVILEVENIATIKDCIRKDLGVSILPKSACMDELRKGKITVMPIENLNMVRETNIVYNQDFTHEEILNGIISLYRTTA
jgi:DNA-binding transcriptional LysR family regulator